MIFIYCSSSNICHEKKKKGGRLVSLLIIKTNDSNSFHYFK